MKLTLEMTRDEAERLAEADHGTDWRLEPGEAIALEDVIRQYARAAGQSA